MTDTPAPEQSADPLFHLSQARGESQRDLTAEQAAERLRALSDVHYKER